MTEATSSRLDPEKVSCSPPARKKVSLRDHDGVLAVPAKRYPNKHENAFAKLASNLGWHVTKQGWPDFLCQDELGNAIMVEVKPAGQLLAEYQWKTMMILSTAGFKCFISDGVSLTSFDPENPPDFYARDE